MMVKLIKYIVYTILALIVISVIGIVILSNVINPNRFKQPIQTQISQVLNRDTHIEGDISWRFFPSLALNVQQITIDNPEGFQNNTLASIGAIAFKVELLPLLHRQINVDNIQLDEMKVNIEFNEAGQSNLDGLGGSDDTPTPIQESNTDEMSYIPISRLKIDNISLNNSQIQYLDQQNDLSLHIENINFQSRQIKTNQSFPINLNFKFNAEQAGSTLASGSARLNGIFKMDMQQLLSSSFNSMEDILDPIVFQGQLLVTPLQISGLNIDDLNADLQIKQRKIQIDPVTMHLYQGVATSNIMIDFSGEVPQYRLDQSLENIQASDLFSDLIGINRITGQADFNMSVTANGTNSIEIVKSLNGSGHYAFTDGQLEGINIPYLIDTATALFNGQAPPQASGANETDFGQLTGTVNIVNGVIQNPDMQMESTHFQANGAGTINLNNQQINYKIQAKILNLAENNAIQQVQDSLGGFIPLQVSGTLESIQVAPDIQTIANNRARSFISEQLNHLTGNNDDGDNGNNNESNSITDQLNNLIGNNGDDNNDNGDDNIADAASRLLNRFLQ